MQAETNDNVTISIKSLEDHYPIMISDKELITSNDDFIDALRYCNDDYPLYTTDLYKYTPNFDISNRITRVIFNDPATIVFWNDGTKTIVKKSEDDIWDPEKGLCMAIIKKINGKTNFIRKIVEENLEESEPHFMSVEEACETLKNFGNNLKGGK